MAWRKRESTPLHLILTRVLFRINPASTRWLVVSRSICRTIVKLLWNSPLSHKPTLFCLQISHCVQQRYLPSLSKQEREKSEEMTWNIKSLQGIFFSHVIDLRSVKPIGDFTLRFCRTDAINTYFFMMLTERNGTKNKPDQIRRKEMKPGETRRAKKPREWSDLHISFLESISVILDHITPIFFWA